MKLFKNDLLISPWKSSIVLGLSMVPLYFLLAFFFKFSSLQFLIVPMVIVIIGLMFFHFFIASMVIKLKEKLVIKTSLLFGITEVARIFYALMMIITYALMDRENIASYAICFFVFYVVTLIIETMFIVKLETQKKGDHEKA